MSDMDAPLLTEVDARDDRQELPATFVFTVTSGPDRGSTFRLEPSQPGRVLVGTSPVCEIRLTDRQVSRRHAALERVGSDVRIADLGSTNGTRVDRVRILGASLQGDEFVRMGQTTFRVTREVSSEGVQLPARTSFGKVIGASHEMQRLYPLCERLADVDVPILIEGETGTGKEVLAESFHEAGMRRNGPFIVFDCTAVPSSLVEAELFGHQRGAFTGADESRAGIFEQANGGTLLVDEIGDLDLALQPKLLRALERREIKRVGGDRWIKVDFRLLSATRRDLDREIQLGRFRDDLFHRLAVARVELPPLRHRRGDVRLLAESFWHELGGDPTSISPAALARWEDYAWPGNVRELRNAVARYHALGEASLLENVRITDERTDLVDAILHAGLPFPQARDKLIDEFEQRFVRHLLELHESPAKAAKASGIGLRYFQKLRARTGR